MDGLQKNDVSAYDEISKSPLQRPAPYLRRALSPTGIHRRAQEIIQSITTNMFVIEIAGVWSTQSGNTQNDMGKEEGLWRFLNATS